MISSAVLVPLLTRLRFLGVLMAGAYLLINALLTLLQPVTVGWPTWAVTALTVPPMVLGMVYLVIPVARRIQQPQRRRLTRCGNALLLRSRR